MLKQKDRILHSAPPILLFWAGLILGLILIPMGITGLNFAYFPGDLGDSRFNLYILEHGYKFLTGQTDQYWNAPFMVPTPNMISFSDNLLGTVPLYSLFRILGFEVFTAFQLWFISLFVLNYTAFYYFAKWLFKNGYAAIVGAFIFAFSIALMGQSSHVQVIPRFFIPLAFYMLLRFRENFSPQYLFLGILFLVGELYSTIYLGLLSFLTAGIMLIIIAAFSYKMLWARMKSFKWWVYILIGALVNVGFMYVLMRPYIARADQVIKTSYIDVVKTIPSPISYLHSYHGTLLWQSLSHTGDTLYLHWNQQLFPGAIALIAFIIFCVFLFKKHGLNPQPVKILAITGLITFAVFIRFDGYSLYRFVYLIPGFDSMRSMDRIINIELLFFGIAGSWLFSIVLRNRKSWQPIATLVALGLLALDNAVIPSQTNRTSVAEAKSRVMDIVARLRDANLPQNALISYEPETFDRGIYAQLDGMLAAQYLDLKSINGYSATCPGAFGKYWVTPNEKNRNYWLNHTFQLAEDTLYVIKSQGVVERVPIDSIQTTLLKTIRDVKIDQIKAYIRSDKKWIKAIEEGAKKNHISVDSMLERNAIWLYEKDTN